MPPSPARRGLAVVAAALLVGGSVALIYFLQVLLVDDRKVSFPSEDDRAAAPRFQSDPLIGRPGTGSNPPMAWPPASFHFSKFSTK
jgi:hypothetical protein